MLTDTSIKQAKPKDKPYKLSDAQGLFLLVNPSKAKPDGSKVEGSRLWRFKYQFANKEKLLSLGNYPLISLKEARQKRDDAKRLLSQGIDPAAERKERKGASVSAGDTFRKIAEDYVNLKTKTWSPRTLKKYLNRLELYVYPVIGAQDIKSITAPELLAMLRDLESKGLGETVHIVRMLCSQIFRSGMNGGKCSNDPAVHLKKELVERDAPKPLASVEVQRTPELLRKIDAYEGHEQTKLALQIMALTFVRTLELLSAKWIEIDWSNELWTIPAERMKGKKKHKKPHIVPLAPQTMKLFERLRELNGHREYIFPGINDPRKPAYPKTLNAALNSLGFEKEMRGHGFRALASTLLNASGQFEPHVIERQLAHVQGSKVKNAYDRGDYLEERCQVMVTWADHLDALRAGVASPVTSKNGGSVQAPRSTPKPSEIAAKLKQAGAALSVASRRMGRGVASFMM